MVSLLLQNARYTTTEILYENSLNDKLHEIVGNKEDGANEEVKAKST